MPHEVDVKCLDWFYACWEEDCKWVAMASCRWLFGCYAVNKCSSMKVKVEEKFHNVSLDMKSGTSYRGVSMYSRPGTRTKFLP